MSGIPGIPKNLQASSCCCFSMRTASLIYGWLGLIFSINGLFVIDEETLQKASPNGNVDEQLVRKILIGCVGFAVTSCLMIVGVMKNKPKLMFPWIYSQFIAIVVLIIGEILLVIWILVKILSSENNGQFSFVPLCGIIVLFVLVDALLIYLVAPVIAHCRQLLEVKKNQLTQSA